MTIIHPPTQKKIHSGVGLVTANIILDNKISEDVMSFSYLSCDANNDTNIKLNIFQL